MNDAASVKKMMVGIAFCAATWLTALIDYYALAGWSLADSLYMVVITIFGGQILAAELHTAHENFVCVDADKERILEATPAINQRFVGLRLNIGAR